VVSGSVRSSWSDISWRTLPWSRRQVAVANERWGTSGGACGDQDGADASGEDLARFLSTKVVSGRSRLHRVRRVFPRQVWERSTNDVSATRQVPGLVEGFESERSR
jgi:hypothetical protein